MLPITEKDLHTLTKQLHCLWQAKDSLVLAIDGKCGSGKSTLADYLSAIYDTSVIHMDDFYLPFSLRTPKRLAEPGGNVHYERFQEEVYQPLLNEFSSSAVCTASKVMISGATTDSPLFSYGVFSCATGTIQSTRSVFRRPLIIVEGSYSMRPQFRALYDLSIFLDVAPQEQLKRLRNRVGSEALSAFQEKWIPLENQYFATGIPMACTYQFCSPSDCSTQSV